jgi:hypothetical protein
MLTDFRGWSDGYEPGGTTTQEPQLGAEAQYTISPEVVTPTNCVTEPEREMPTWFSVRPLSGIVLQDGDEPMPLVNLMARVL